jgi:predicted neutral ceramidase superfamily lipid hydrolase
MTLDALKLVILSACVFTVVLFIIALISKYFLRKLWQKPLWLKTAIFFGITHFTITTITAVYIGMNLKNDREFGMLWSLFIYGDFPVSFLIWPIDEMFIALINNPKIYFLLDSLIVPYFLFAILGSLQYCIWGGLVGKLLNLVNPIVEK